MGIKQRIEKQKAADKDQSIFAAGQNLGFQQACDYFMATLADEDVMGNDGVFNAEQLEKIGKAVIERDHYYSTAFSNNVEADVYREKLDRELKRIFTKDFDDFSKRYPDVKEISYKYHRSFWD